MSKADCIAALMRGGVDEAKATDIVDSMLQEKKALSTAALPADLAAAWSRQMADAQRAAVLKKRHAALTILKRKGIDDFITGVKAEGFSTLDALEAMMVGSNKNFKGARTSAMSRRWGITESWAGPMINDLEAIPGALRLMRDDESFTYAVMREMISPESTGDDVARKAAQVFSDYAELSRKQANLAGADIGELKNWAPQSHDPIRLLAKENGGAEGWKQFVTDRIDIERTFPGASGNPEIFRAALDGAFTVLTTGRDPSATMLSALNANMPANLAKSMSFKHRTLHFKDAGSAIEYHQRYGKGTVLSSVLSTLEARGRSVAMMETFGPNPEQMIRDVLEREKDAIALSPMDAEQKKAEIDKLNAAWRQGVVTSGDLARWYAELSGQTISPVSMLGARVASGIRGVQSSAKLMGATLSSLADVFTKANALRYRGKNLFESWHGAFTQTMFEGMASKEKKQLARRLGNFIEGTTRDMAQRFSDVEMDGLVSKMNNVLFRWSGLTQLTEAHKAGYITALAADLGEMSGKRFDAIDQHLSVVLHRQGIDATMWDIIRQMKDTVGGKTYIVPEKAHWLPDESVLPLISKERVKMGGEALTEALTSKRNELESKLMGMYADECRYAIIEPDDKTRAAMVWGTRPGTWLGEGLRFVTQFKSFPIAYAQRILGEGRWKRAADANLPAKMLGLSHFIAGSLVFGYIAMTLKDIAKGKTPKDPRKLDTIMAAALQSGGAGLYGDFLFGKVSRTGNTLAENLAGPTLSTVGRGVTVAQDLVRGNVADAGGDALRFVLDNTPGINLWYTRAALDYMLLFHIREMLSPGTLRRTESKMKSEYNQTYMLPPSSVIKRGGGFK